MSVTDIQIIDSKKLEKTARNIMQVEYYATYKKRHYTNKWLKKKSQITSCSYNKFYFKNCSRYNTSIDYK